MTKYRVRYEIDEEVEAENREEAIENALCQKVNCPYFFSNEITDSIKINADVEELEGTND